jgi:hypothetical protein
MSTNVIKCHQKTQMSQECHKMTPRVTECPKMSIADK